MVARPPAPPALIRAGKLALGALFGGLDDSLARLAAGPPRADEGAFIPENEYQKRKTLRTVSTEQVSVRVTRFFLPYRTRIDSRRRFWAPCGRLVKHAIVLRPSKRCFSTRESAAFLDKQVNTPFTVSMRKRQTQLSDNAEDWPTPELASHHNALCVNRGEEAIMQNASYHLITAFIPLYSCRLFATGMPSAPRLRMNAFWASESHEALTLRSRQPGIHRGKTLVSKPSSFVGRGGENR